MKALAAVLIGVAIVAVLHRLGAPRSRRLDTPDTLRKDGLL